MEAHELVTKFLEIAKENDYDFEIFRETDLEEFGLDWVGQHEWLGSRPGFDYDDEEVSQVHFIDHKFILQETKYLVDGKQIVEYWSIDDYYRDIKDPKSTKIEI